MDNPEITSDPSGEADVTASQGQSDATETQPVETEAVVDGNESAEAGTASSNPWDNDPKFKGKSPEDIYKAYKESEKLSGQLSQKAQIANLIEEKYGVSPEELKAQIEHQEMQRKQQLYANNPLAPVMDEVAQLRRVVEQQESEKALASEEKELDNFLKDNPAYAPHRDKILKLGLSTEQDKTYEDIAKEWFGEARAQGQQDAYNKIETKKMTQPSGVSSAPKKELSLDDMRGMSAAELREILPHAQ